MGCSSAACYFFSNGTKALDWCLAVVTFSQPRAELIRGAHQKPITQKPDVKVFAGTSNLPLAEAICANIGIEQGKLSITAFPDGESFAKIEENVRGEDVFVIQSTCPPTNHHLMELFIIMDALKRASADRITAVLPLSLIHI